MEEKLDERSAPVTLRPATDEDEPFLFAVYASTRAEEMAVVPWDDAQKEAFLKMQFTAQQTHYRNFYTGTSHDIILLGEQAVGRLYVSRGESEIRILDITILPEYRSKGIGTPLIKELMTEAEREAKSLTIHVESYNPSLRLFERLGFSKIADEGIYHLMERRP
ncbi:MAG: GNAT family N-acetyltransferase [Pyrinomonadaceae bacterium]|nr:GNAT family N-acetyltransferase [Pyrinomonadaceae bacterium]